MLFLDAAGKTLSQFNLSEGQHTLIDKQPWIVNAKAVKINDGLWQLPGGRVESDLGGQWVIEGPDGLILIEGHAGLSFERERKAMQAAGLDPHQVKYVLNFSGTDVLASLRKLEGLNVDYILPGHGPITSLERYVAAGIGVGRHMGWGKMQPEVPDPRFRLQQENVIVVAWNLDETSADFGDLNGDGQPDVAVVVPEGKGAIVKLFLNQRGKFAEKPDVELPVPSVEEPSKLRVRELNGDGRLDLFVGGRTSSLLLSHGKFPAFEATSLSLGEGNHARRVELSGDGKPDIIVNAKFGALARVGERMGDAAQTHEITPRVAGPNLDVWSGDVNGDGLSDLVCSYGQVFLRSTDGKLSAEPSIQLPAAKDRDWCYFAVADFNRDAQPDLVFFTAPQEVPSFGVFYNTRQPTASFPLVPSATFDLADPPGEKKN